MKIAVVTNKPYHKCETFVKSQIDMLPFEMTQYWGSKLPFNIKRNTRGLFFKLLMKLGLFKNKSRLDLFVDHLSSNKVELVFAQYGMIGDRVYLACKELNLPLVVYFYGHDAVRKTILTAYDNYKKLFSYQKLTVVTVSHEMTKRLIEIGCPKNKIVYNVCVPTDDFLELTPTFNKKQFVSLGRFVDKKAPHLTILAFNEVLKSQSDATLIFAGDGPLWDSCKDLVQALGIANQVSLPGRITPLKFQDYLSESMGYVQHSIEAQDGDMEGTPVSILEASAAGLPIISTHHAGIPEVIVHNETGLLSEEKDIKTMAKNILWVLENKQAAQNIGAKGKMRVQKQYTMSHHIETLANIIQASAK